MKIIRVLFYYLLGVLGILGVSIAPQVIRERGLYNFVGFIEEYIKFFFLFINKENWSYTYKGATTEIFDMLWGPFVYSMQILLSALVLGVVLAFVLTMFTVFLPRWVMKPIKQLLSVLETVPDLMVAFMLQLFIVFFFKTFGFELMSFTALGEEKVYLAPIITISILPMIGFFRIMLLVIEEELLKPHIEFATSKGLTKARIMGAHVLKNISPSLFFHGKMILWGMLSSLFIIETIFNMRGITYYIVEDFRPMVIAISLLMIYSPFFLIYQLIYMWLNTESYVDFTKYKKDKKHWREWKIWSWIRLSASLLKQHMKNPKFFIGFVVLFGMVGYSLAYSIFVKEPIFHIQFMKDENGRIISGPPHPPSDQMILGSDFYGYSILDQLIVGAKYTLLFALIVACLRVIGGFYLGVAYHFYLSESRKQWLNRVVDSIHFLPLSIIAYLMLRPVLWGLPVLGWDHSMFERLVFEAIVLTILVLPLTTILIGNELNLISRNDFVLSAKVMGGSNKHLLWVHLFPHLAPRLFIIYGQQFIQVLLILVHLGMFHLFLGGTIVSDNGMMADPPKSGTYEWSGLISSARYSLMTGKYWIVIAPLFAFMIAILSMQMMVQGIKEIQQRKVGVLTNFKRAKRKKQKEQAAQYAPSIEDFQIQNNHSKHG